MGAWALDECSKVELLPLKSNYGRRHSLKLPRIYAQLPAMCKFPQDIIPCNTERQLCKAAPT